MEKKAWQTPTLMFLILIVIGGAIAGTVNAKSFITINSDCMDEADNDGDGNEDLGLDVECSEYPYEDGEGEDGTSLGDSYNSPIGKYQSGFDLLVDYTRYGINKNCSGEAALCGVSGVNNEVDFFCFLEANSVISFSSMVQAWAARSGYDDGSYQMIQNLCNTFPPTTLTELPLINYQESDPTPAGSGSVK